MNLSSLSQFKCVDDIPQFREFKSNTYVLSNDVNIIYNFMLNLIEQKIF